MDNEGLLVKIKADISNLKQECENASGHLSKFKDGASKVGEGVKTAMKTVGVAVAGVATAVAGTTKAVVDQATKTAQVQDEIDKASQRMQVTSDFYQELSYNCDMAGVSMGTMEKAALTLQKSGSDLTFDEAINSIMELESAEDRMAMASELFGEKVAYQMTPLLNEGGESFKALSEEAHKLGIVMDENSIKAGANFQDSLDKLNKTVDGVKNNLISNFMPSLTTTMDGLADLFGGVEGGQEKVEEGIKEFVASMTETLPKFLELGVSMISGLIGGIANSFPQLTDTIVDVLLDLVDVIIDNLPIILKAGVEILLALGQGLADALPDLVPTIVDVMLLMVDTLFDNIPLIIDIAKQIMFGLIKGIIDNLPELLKCAGKLVASLIEAFLSLLGIHSPSKVFAGMGKNLVLGLWEGLKNNLQWLRDCIKKWVGNVTSFIKKLFGIHSPSKVFAGYGRFLSMGLGEGLEDSVGYTTDAIQKTASAMEDAFNPNLEVNELGIENSLGDYTVSGQVRTASDINLYNEDWIDKLANIIMGDSKDIVLNVDGRQFAKASIRTINDLTKQTGSLGLVIA